MTQTSWLRQEALGRHRRIWPNRGRDISWRRAEQGCTRFRNPV